MTDAPMDIRMRKLRDDFRSYMDDRIKKLQDDLEATMANCVEVNESVLWCELDAVAADARALGKAIAERDAMCFHMHIRHPGFALEEEQDAPEEDANG